MAPRADECLPPLVAIEQHSSGDSSRWTLLNHTVAGENLVRIAAEDLRAAQKATAEILAEAGGGRPVGPQARVLLDLVVHVAPDVSTARTEVAAAERHSSSVRVRIDGGVSYVGSPSGLVCLIEDIESVGVADGVTIIPAVVDKVGSAACMRLLTQEVLPTLHHGNVGYIPGILESLTENSLD